tara:strand:- start:477 stop:1025 length:549 start_codon:yes stop_codon:yes gene_type:complete
MLRRLLRVAAIGLLLSMGNSLAEAGEAEMTLLLELKDGTVVIELFPQLAPKHVARIKELVREGYYDGKTWHRVIDGFMAQAGSLHGDGRGGTGQKLHAEFSEEKHVRGIASMARTRDPNSADAQFFIMLAPAPHLDGNYTVWGRVVSGMDLIENIKKGDQNNNGTVVDPDIIVSMKVQGDVQ